MLLRSLNVDLLGAASNLLGMESWSGWQELSQEPSVYC